MATAAAASDKREADLDDAVEKQSFDLRGPIGQLWSRELTERPELKDNDNDNDTLI